MSSTTSASCVPPDSAPAHPGDETPSGTPQSGEGPCPRCGGSGQLAGNDCPDCEGSGTVTVMIGDA